MDGYAKLATLMGAYPEIAIVRRFSALNAQGILYLQAELVYLESRLRGYEDEDRKSGDQNRVDFALDFTKLSNITLNPTRDGTLADDHERVLKGRRWTLIEIQRKLKAYSKHKSSTEGSQLSCARNELIFLLTDEAVLQQAAIAQMKKPNVRDLRFL